MIVSIDVQVDGMHCTSCALLIDETVEELDGVEQCSTDRRRGRSRVAYDPARVSADAIAAAIIDAGYPAQPFAPGG